MLVPGRVERAQNPFLQNASMVASTKEELAVPRDSQSPLSPGNRFQTVLGIIMEEIQDLLKGRGLQGAVRRRKSSAGRLEAEM